MVYVTQDNVTGYFLPVTSFMVEQNLTPVTDHCDRLTQILYQSQSILACTMSYVTKVFIKTDIVI